MSDHFTPPRHTLPAQENPETSPWPAGAPDEGSPYVDPETEVPPFLLTTYVVLHAFDGGIEQRVQARLADVADALGLVVVDDHTAVAPNGQTRPTWFMATEHAADADQ
jgi:hypothetical protein